MLTSVVAVALAGSAWLQNDNFTGSGTVNSAVSFGTYEGAAAIFTPDGGYPVTVKAIDVLMVTYNQGAPGQFCAFLLDIWDEQSGGLLDPPRMPDGGPSVRRVAQQGFQLITSTSSFGRITLTPPLVLNGGRLFVSLGEQDMTSNDRCTVALDTAPLVPGANWYRSEFGVFDRIDLPDGGFFNGINHNWIMRAVIEVPDVSPTVTSVFPSSGPNSTATPVLISGTSFDFAARTFLGTTELTVTGRTGSTGITATVPAGLVPGSYPVSVQNTPVAVGVLQNAFTVLTGDGGTAGGAGGGSGTAGGSSGTGGGSGTAGGSSAGGTGGSGGSGGGATGAALRLDDITPASGFNQDTTKVVLTGDGFQQGAEVAIGPKVLDAVTVKSAAVINADVPPGLTPDTYDVEVINLDGKRAKLDKAFTVVAGSSTKGGCGCGSAALLPLAALASLLRLRRRPAVTRGAPKDGEAPSRP